MNIGVICCREKFSAHTHLNIEKLPLGVLALAPAFHVGHEGFVDLTLRFLELA